MNPWVMSLSGLKAEPEPSFRGSEDVSEEGVSYLWVWGSICRPRAESEQSSLGLGV